MTLSSPMPKLLPAHWASAAPLLLPQAQQNPFANVPRQAQRAQRAQRIKQEPSAEGAGGAEDDDVVMIEAPSSSHPSEQEEAMLQ